MPTFFHHLKRKTLTLFNRLSDLAIFVGLVLVGGLASSWYMVSVGSPLLTTHSIGPWVTWTAEGRGDADPYTRAHFARSGTLNLSTELAGTYVASQDSDGMRLHSSCEYSIKGKEIDARWWSISVFDDAGRLIPNPAERYSFTSDTVVVEPDNAFTVTLARDARPGNWLPTGGGGRLTLVLAVVEAARPVINGEVVDISLPRIERVACR